MTLAVRPPLQPMLAKLERRLPLAGYVYEPKWDAFRALVFRDGELVVPRGAGLDFAALMARLHPAATRVEELRRSAPAPFVAFDLVALGERDLRGEPFAARRRMLACLLAGRSFDPIVLTPATEDSSVAGTWLHEFSSRGIDGVVAKSPAMPYSPGKRSMVKVKQERGGDARVARADGRHRAAHVSRPRARPGAPHGRALRSRSHLAGGLARGCRCGVDDP